jgi:hypothetical protein
MRIPSPKIAGKTSRNHVNLSCGLIPDQRSTRKKINSHSKISLPEIDVGACSFMLRVILPEKGEVFAVRIFKKAWDYF